MNAMTGNKLVLRCLAADDAAFAPYGRLVRRPENTAAKLAAGAVESWRLPFEAGSTPEIMFNRYHDKGRDFSVMERHLHVTQCFFPLGGVPYIMVVGLDKGPDQPITPQDVKAFYIEGNHGVLLWKNVWHSLARFPVGAEYIDLAFITDEDTQSEIEGHLAGGPRPQRTDFIDFEKTHQTSFLVSDPDFLGR
jgi:ureidoglycolate lyase